MCAVGRVPEFVPLLLVLVHLALVLGDLSELSLTSDHQRRLTGDCEPAADSGLPPS